MRGSFITLEGGEGAGKSTQARLLAKALGIAGLPVLSTREPGGTPGAEQLRALLLDANADWSPRAEILLHFAARADHVERRIRPALDNGSWVICDRYYDSTMAYQGYGLGGDRAMIAELSRMVGLAPDLTIVLDVSVDTSFQRLHRRGADRDRYERLGADFFARVNAGFRAIAAENPGRCVLIPAEGAEQEVAATIREVVRTRLGGLT